MCEKTSEKRMIKERLRDAGPSYDNYGTSNGEDEDDKSTNDEDKECDEQALLFSWTCSLALLIIVGVHQRTGCGGECQYVGGKKLKGARLVNLLCEYFHISTIRVLRLPASSVFDFRGDPQEDHKGGVPGARKGPILHTWGGMGRSLR